LGQLICLKAEDLLATFVPNGVLDEGLFKSTIGSLIDQARESGDTGHRARVRVFGEMVSQLRTRNLTVTTRLEELWGKVVKDHSVSLLCTYALQNEGDHIPQVLTSLHSHSIEREFGVSRND
jgi:hypothetical protein